MILGTVGLLAETGLPGTYTVQYSGGTCTVIGGGGGGAYALSSGYWGRGGTGTSVACSGQITATFTWSGNGEPAPPVAIVRQRCQASAWAYGAGCSASASNDLGDTAVTVDTSIPPYKSRISGMNGANYIDHYSVVQNPGNEFSVYCSPTASASGSPATASVWYQAAATPVTIHFADGNGIGEDHERKYLIGQQMIAEVSSTLEQSEWEWSVEGGDPFKEFAITGTTGWRVDLQPSDLASEHLAACFAQKELSVSVSADVHFLVPTGAKPESGLDATVSATLETDKPSYTEDDVEIGEFQKSPSGDACVLSQVFSQYYTGTYMGFGVRASLTVPEGFSTGKWNWVQIVDIGDSRIHQSVTEHLETAEGETEGHDHSWPYNSVKPDYDQGGTHRLTGASIRAIWDSPLETFQVCDIQGHSNCVSEYHCEKHFESFAMFLPSGSCSQHVPVRELRWFVSQTFTRNGSSWDEGSVSPDEGITFNDAPSEFPCWYRIITTDILEWH